MSFKSLGLSHNLALAAQKLGYQSPFPIQEQAIPHILDGKDVMGIAPTGSGKSAAFVMPILDRLQDQKVPKSRNLQVLVLVPTRELAMQIDDVFIDMSEPLKREIRSMAVYGGVSINPQMKNLYGTEILVATPGRLLDLLDQNALSLHEVQHLVIDEADKMFQMGFGDEMNRVLAMLPSTKQTTLFSATLTDSVKDIQQQLGIEPIVVSVVEEKVDIHSIQQIAYLIPVASKGPFLRYLIKEHKIEQALVFASSTRTVDNVVTKLKKNGVPASAIHGKKSQGARTSHLKGFKDGTSNILVATDLIGRGIHIEGLQAVINYELPRSPLDYVHRIGRTGRANMTGQAITLLTEADLHHFKIIQKKMGQRVEIKDMSEINLHGF